MIAALTAILSVALIEIMLSVDNALINASLAKKLPHALQHKAIYTGITLGAFFRVFGLLIASVLITNPVIKVLSALYLFWLAYEHLILKKKEGWSLRGLKGYHTVMIQIALANLIFSIDNVVGIVGISHQVTYLILGVLTGVIALISITPFVLKLMHRYPSLEKITYALLAYIGLTILIEEITLYHTPEYITFFCIAVAMLTAIVIDRKHQSSHS